MNTEYYFYHSRVGDLLCLSRDTSDGWSILAADWDYPYSDQIWDEMVQIMSLLPEAGTPALYTTGHGVHALWPNLVRWEDAKAILQLFTPAEAVVTNRYGAVVALIGDGQGFGTICHGFSGIARRQGQIYLRVGRKPDREADIRRITRRADNADSPIIQAHDAMVRRYNHQGKLSALQDARLTRQWLLDQHRLTLPAPVADCFLEAAVRCLVHAVKRWHWRWQVKSWEWIAEGVMENSPFPF